jgi:hypothetical protein
MSPVLQSSMFKGSVEAEPVSTEKYDQRVVLKLRDAKASNIRTKFHGNTFGLELSFRGWKGKVCY